MPVPVAWGGAAWGGSRTARPGRPPGYAVPGYDAVYYWRRSSSSPGWGQAAWGGRSAIQLPSAGLLAAPDAADGTVTVQAWWAFAAFVTVTRIDPDGSRVPLRSSPVAMPEGSRRNPASNPKARDSAAGYTAGANTTISQATGLSTPIEGVTTAVRLTATSAGQVSVTVPADVVAAATTTFGVLARTSAAATDLRIPITWYDDTGTSLGTQTYSVPAAQRAQAATGWTWCTVTVDAWPTGALTGLLGYSATGLPAGGTLEVTARIHEAGTTVGDYFDGDRRGAAWVGTAGLSASDLSPIVLVVDAEAPLDVPVRYELTSARAPGYSAVTEPVVLPSGRLHFSRRQCLMTHPGLARTIRVWVEDEPTIRRSIEQAAFAVKGRRRKVVVSESHRGGDEGELIFVAETAEERARLMDFLDDGSPLLLRFPASYGHPPLWWLSFGDVQILPQFRNAPRPLRRLKAPFVEVDRPTTAARPLVA